MASPAPRPILIAGPTASGKSALALAIAERVGGVIINADSMQVYRELHVLTARPSAADEQRVSHRLYGHVSVLEPYSVARWLVDVESVLAEVRETGLRPIIVGGTGLYFKALTEGLSPLPPIPDAIRQHWRSIARQSAAGALHGELHKRDRIMADRLTPRDIQRITRALEVIDATGRSLADWQACLGTPLILPDDAIKLRVDRPRLDLQARADQRFDAMIAEGAVEEVRAVMALSPSPEAPAVHALGFNPLAEMVAGRLPIEAAAEMSRLATRQYIKRQQTWLKRYMIAWNPIEMTDHCEIDAIFMTNID